MKLEIVISGDFYVIRALRLNKRLVQIIKTKFGGQWTSILNSLGSAPDRRDVRKLVKTKVGSDPPVAYSIKGVHLGGKTLGIVITTDGQDVPFDKINQRPKAISIADLQKANVHSDILGIFSGRGAGIIKAVWNDVSEFDQELIQVLTEDVSHILKKSKPLEIINDILYDGKKFDHIICTPRTEVIPENHIFHVKR